jgi:hypothetical protein
LYLIIQINYFLGEIDRCLKKVAEGVETFEDIWQKVDKMKIMDLIMKIKFYLFIQRYIQHLIIIKKINMNKN